MRYKVCDTPVQLLLLRIAKASKETVRETKQKDVIVLIYFT